jgi:hypothetical protein
MTKKKGKNGEGVICAHTNEILMLWDNLYPRTELEDDPDWTCFR